MAYRVPYAESTTYVPGQVRCIQIHSVILSNAKDRCSWPRVHRRFAQDDNALPGRRPIAMYRICGTHLRPRIRLNERYSALLNQRIISEALQPVDVRLTA